MKYIVSLYGARAHYAVPRILHQHGLLARFYTDVCAAKGITRLVRLVPSSLLPNRLRRLRSRVPTGIPPSLITSFASFGFRINHKWAQARSAEEAMGVYLDMGRGLSERVLARGFNGASAVYAFNGEGLELLERARKLGIRTILEQTIAPKEIEERLMAEERSLHPGWDNASHRNRYIQIFLDRQHAEWAASDLVICGSAFVEEGVQSCARKPVATAVVPYGVDLPAVSVEREPHAGPLRVLTVGTLNLRKGAPYLADAARALNSSAEFRVLGSCELEPSIQSDFERYVDVRGRVPRFQVAEHLRWADVFLLPTICEGSAVACYEALAYGLPVITTPNAGSIVRDGVEGFIVPIRDVAAIVRRLEALQASPEMLRQMAHAAMLRAKEFTLETYGRRLLAALGES